MTRTYQIAVGDITCATLHEGKTPVDMNGLMMRYPQVTEEQIIEALGGKTESQNSFNPVYIDTGTTKILADVGFGEARRPELGNLEPALNSIGVSAGDIDIVYLTHFHGDHIAGLLTLDGKPSFPNARYITCQAEWDEWIPRWEASDQDGHQQQLAMIKSLEDQFTLVNEGDEFVAGVSVVALPGHTLGQSGLLIESNGERLIHLADVLHNPLQFKHTDWQFKFDSDGALGVETRQYILKRCVDENLLTTFYHLPFPGMGHIIREGDTFAWKPL
jgi:glyoxylase-like metal-dependent hydrolase (beta-lactamase superfamily II)